jgi:hypothetical protein
VNRRRSGEIHKGDEKGPKTYSWRPLRLCGKKEFLKTSLDFVFASICRLSGWCATIFVLLVARLGGATVSAEVVSHYKKETYHFSDSSGNGPGKITTAAALNNASRGNY